VLLWNLLLALVWTALSREVTPRTFAVGFAVGYLVLVLSHRALRDQGYLVRLRRMSGFAGFFVKELVAANLKLAGHVLAPSAGARPGLIAVRLEARTDLEITMVANCITLTPGSLSLELSADRRTLYVHVMFTRDLERLRREIREGLERRLLEILR
jgi:multicomponent Na+:H+ antiporter subunit E